MTYIPTKVISVVNNRLIESTNLTKALSTYLLGDHYLVLEKNRALYRISINAALVSGTFNLTSPLSSAFTAQLNDLFVAKYSADHIPVKATSGLYERRLRVFNPLTYKNYDVYFTSINTPDVRNDPTRKGYLDDLAIAADEDMSNFLVAVNGVFHRTMLLNNVLYVLDGYRTIRLSGRKDILIVDTKDVGGHTILPLTTDNVTKPGYQKRAIIKTTNSLLGRSAFLVVDGYFYHRDHRVIEYLDKKRLAINTNKLPLIQQFRHNPRTVYKRDRYGVDASQKSRKYDDAYETVFLDKRAIPTATLANKDFQYSRLTHYHSFLVVMNNPALFTLSMEVASTGTPQLYYDASKQRISGMLNYGCGLCPSYLIWNDSFDRKSVFLSDQDADVDRQDDTINSLFIPVLYKEPQTASHLHAEFFDYVCA